MSRLSILLIVNYILATSAGGQTPYFQEYSLGEIYKDTRVNLLYELKSGYIWFGTTDGLFRYDGLQYEQYLMPDSLTNNHVRALYECPEGKLWVGYEDGNIFYNDFQNNFTQWEPEEGTPNVPITGLYDDGNNNFWIATYGEGVYCYQQGRMYNINIDDGLPGDDIYTMVQDKIDNIWLGTDGGIVKCQLIEGEKQIDVFSSSDGLPDDIVRTLEVDKNGNFWIGMHDGGICYFDPYNKIVETYFSEWKYGIVNALELYEGRELWIGTEGNGTFRFNLGNQSISRVGADPNYIKAKIYDLHKDIEGNIWMVSNTNGVCSANRQFEIIQKKLPNIQAIMVDHKDQLWVGTQNGLFLHQVMENGESSFRLVFDNLNVISLYEDKFQNIWIGTFGDGVYIYDSKTKHTRQLTENEGLTNGSILSIDGANENIWLATLGGVTEIENSQSILSNSKLNIKKLDKESGLGANYIYTVFVDSKGRTWFGTDGKGISVLENGIIMNYSHVDSLPIGRVYSITEDQLSNIWLSTEKEGIFEFDGKSFHRLTIKEGIRDMEITSLISDTKGNILVIHPSGIDILDPRTKHLIYYDAEIGVENIEPHSNVVCNDKYGNIWIGTQDQLIRYTALNETLEIHPRTQLNSVSVFLDPIDFRTTNTFSHNQNSLIFNYVGLWYTDPSTVKYRYKLDGINHDWIISRDRNATYPNLPPGDYTFRVTSTENDAFDKEPVVTYSFTINSPFWMQAWFIFLAVTMIVAIIYFTVKDREKRLKRQADLKKERIESQLELLKSQINPHFLFNNFNTLIAIIDEDPNLAIEYVERLSDFYRSILQYREKDVINIQEEIVLIQNYNFLLQKRFGNYFNIKIKTSKNLNGAYIVPLTLQMLVENAVKHNVISKNKPLNIDISIGENQYISVTNNLQQKLTRQQSTGFGLQSIKTRYALLSNKEVKIEETDNYFKVQIPIIKKEES